MPGVSRGRGPAGRGFSLIEIILSVGLLAVGLLIVLGLIPISVLSLKKAEDTQSAAAYGLELIADARAQDLTSLGQRRVDLSMNGGVYHFVREIYAVDASLVDVVVVATWQDEVPPLRLNTRMRRKK